MPLNVVVSSRRAGMLKQANTHEVEICWEPPKGDFTKYVLSGRVVIFKTEIFLQSFTVNFSVTYIRAVS
jgi:hypothetical protein